MQGRAFSLFLAVVLFSSEALLASAFFLSTANVPANPLRTSSPGDSQALIFLIFDMSCDVGLLSSPHHLSPCSQNLPPLDTACHSIRGGCASSLTMSSVPTLFDMPVSNNGARCRIIIYKKGLSLTDDVLIKSPVDLGGLKSPEYLALNPQGLMPLLVTPEGSIPESDTSE